MATASGLVLNDEVMNANIYEGLAKQILQFNQGSDGVINLVERGGHIGRSRTSTFFKTTSGLVKNRNPENTSTITPTTFNDVAQKEIRVYRTVVHDWYDQDFRDKGLNTTAGQEQLGFQLGEAVAEDMANVAIASAVGALLKIGGDVTFDATGQATKTLTHSHLNSGLRKFGDSSGNVRAFVMQGVPWHDLIGDAITNQEFSAAGVALFQGSTPTAGRRALVTDVSTLFVDIASSVGADNYYSLGLVPGAVEVEESEPPVQSLVEVTGTGAAAPANRQWRFRSEWGLTIKVRGMTWAGAAKPDTADLATLSNWTLAASSYKNGPGVLIKTQ